MKQKIKTSKFEYVYYIIILIYCFRRIRQFDSHFHVQSSMAIILNIFVINLITINFPSMSSIQFTQIARHLHHRKTTNMCRNGFRRFSYLIRTLISIPMQHHEREYEHENRFHSYTCELHNVVHCRAVLCVWYISWRRINSRFRVRMCLGEHVEVEPR